MSDWRDNAFPISSGKVSLTSGTFNYDCALLCVADGSITVDWKDGTQEIVNLVAGNAVQTKDALKVTISSGTFHIG